MTKNYNELYDERLPITRIKYIDIVRILVDNLIELNPTESPYSDAYRHMLPITRLNVFNLINTMYLNILSMDKVSTEDKDRLKAIDPYTRTKITYNLSVMVDILKKLNTAQPQKLTEIRYIRDWLNGWNYPQLPDQNRWVKGEAYVNGENVALNKPVSASFENQFPDRPISRFTAPGLTPSLYITSDPNNGWQYLEIDLEALYKVEFYRTWHGYVSGFDTQYNSRIEVSADGVYWEVIYDSATDGFITEGGRGNDHQVIDPRPAVPGGFRYIRDWVNGSDKREENTWVEGQLFIDGNNVALHKPVTANFENPVVNLQYFTDGNTNTNYAFGSREIGWYYVQIDLGEIKKIEEYRYWHFWGWSELWNHRVEVSKDGETWQKVWDTEIDGLVIEPITGGLVEFNTDEI